MCAERECVYSDRQVTPVLDAAALHVLCRFFLNSVIVQRDSRLPQIGAEEPWHKGTRT